jgi:hypothetical protein
LNGLFCYLRVGLSILQEPDEDLTSEPEIELSSFSTEVANINKNLEKAKTSNLAQKIMEPKSVDMTDEGSDFKAYLSLLFKRTIDAFYAMLVIHEVVVLSICKPNLFWYCTEKRQINY